MAASCISFPAASPQNSQANSTKGRSRRLRARTLAANSITSEEEDELFRSSILSLLYGVPGTRRRGTSFEHFIENIEIAGEQVHTKCR